MTIACHSTQVPKYHGLAIIIGHWRALNPNRQFRRPRNRLKSAAKLAQGLQRYQQGRPIAARPVGRPERMWRWCRRNPRDAVLVGLAGMLLALVVSGEWWFDRQRSEKAR